jgi:hypothetical protein
MEHQKPEDLLVEDWIPTYKEQINVLHAQLVDIRSMLFILERIAKFPFHMFGEHHGPFWPLIRQSLETSIIVGLWRILIDDDSGALTLRRLRNGVILNAIDDTARKHLRKQLRSEEAQLKIAGEKIHKLRQRYFAHLDESFATGASEEARLARLTFDELQGLALEANRIINALGMGTEYMTIQPQYDPRMTQFGKPVISDIERILDDMASRCDRLRMPESRPEFFSSYWKHRSNADRAAFNVYRMKFGLPEIPTDE